MLELKKNYPREGNGMPYTCNQKEDKTQQNMY